MTDKLDEALDRLVALPGDDVVAVFRGFIDDLNAAEGTTYDQRLVILETVVDRLNAACARRAAHILQ